jgi:hypothetical protein
MSYKNKGYIGKYIYKVLKLVVDLSKDTTDYISYGFNKVNTIEPLKIECGVHTLYNCGYKEFSYE